MTSKRRRHRSLGGTVVINWDFGPPASSEAVWLIPSGGVSAGPLSPRSSHACSQPADFAARILCYLAGIGVSLVFLLTVRQPPGVQPARRPVFEPRCPAASKARADRRIAGLCCVRSPGAGETGQLRRLAE